MSENIKTITIDQLLSETKLMLDQKARLVQISATVNKEASTVELSYSFDINYQLSHLRVATTQNTPIPSITPNYWYAFLYENEINELFGLSITGMTVDYKGTLYKKRKETPFYSIGEKQ